MLGQWVPAGGASIACGFVSGERDKIWRMPNVLKKLPGVAMAILALFSGVGPRNAGSHLAEWASLFGIENIPIWLTSTAADRWGFCIGLVGFIAWGLWYFDLSGKIRGKDQRSRRSRIS
jgi:hypothetical protein